MEAKKRKEAEFRISLYQYALSTQTNESSNSLRSEAIYSHNSVSNGGDQQANNEKNTPEQFLFADECSPAFHTHVYELVFYGNHA